MIYTEAVSKIADTFAKKFKAVENVKYGYDNTIYNIVESVLSLERNYVKRVLPMVNHFKERFPEIEEIDKFIETFDKYKESNGLINFRKYAKESFGCYEERKAKIIYNLIIELKPIIKGVLSKNEFNIFSEWAKNTTPEEAYILNVEHFKIAGFQYLRMLFGVDTVKPDIRIKRFIKSVLGDEFKNDLLIIKLFEDAAKEVNISVIALNKAVWDEYGNN